jgi:hypothetical protein
VFLADFSRIGSSSFLTRLCANWGGGAISINPFNWCRCSWQSMFSESVQISAVPATLVCTCLIRSSVSKLGPYTHTHTHTQTKHRHKHTHVGDLGNSSCSRQKCYFVLNLPLSIVRWLTATPCQKRGTSPKWTFPSTWSRLLHMQEDKLAPLKPFTCFPVAFVGRLCGCLCR